MIATSPPHWLGGVEGPWTVRSVLHVGDATARSEPKGKQRAFCHSQLVSLPVKSLANHGSATLVDWAPRKPAGLYWCP